MMSELYRCHKYLLESGNLDDVDRGYFKKVLCGELDHLRLRKAIHRLSRMLCEHHGRKVIILLDEYDNPINNSYGKPFHQDVINVMRDVLSSALKGNESLEFGVITGVMQIAKESIFSGLNSLYVNNILSEDFDESFGFTDGEVRSILEDNGHPEKYQEAKEWYDGYRFGNTHVYNPWSILNYVKSNFKPRPYWAGTSGNDILRTLIDGADDSVFDDLLSLSQGMSIRKRLDTTVTMRDLEHDDNAIFSLMVMSGYLTAVEQDGGHMLLIPNGEMYRVFGDMIGIHLNRRCGNSRCGLLIHDLSRAILRNDPKAIESNLYDLLATVIGSNMLTHEHVYQGFLVGLLMHLSGKYRVTAEMENGKGRYDIMLRSKSSENPNIIMELKRSDSESSLQHDAEQALSQIMERDYIHGLKGDILLYGIAFHGKEPRIVSEMIRQNR